MPGNCTLRFRLDEFLWRVHFSITSPTAFNGPPKARQIFLILAALFYRFAYTVFFQLNLMGFCKSLLRFLKSTGPPWSTFGPLRGQGRFCSELLRFGQFQSLSKAKTILGQNLSVFDHSGPFQGQGCSGASCPGPAGAFPEYAPAMRRQLPDDDVQGSFFPQIAWKH